MLWRSKQKTFVKQQQLSKHLDKIVSVQRFNVKMAGGRMGRMHLCILSGSANPLALFPVCLCHCSFRWRHLITIPYCSIQTELPLPAETLNKFLFGFKLLLSFYTGRLKQNDKAPSCIFTSRFSLRP